MNDIEKTMEMLKSQVRDLQMENERLVHNSNEFERRLNTEIEQCARLAASREVLDGLNNELRAKMTKQDELIVHLQKRCKDESAAADRVHDQLKETAKTCDNLRGELREYNPTFIEMAKAAHDTLKILGIDSPFTHTNKETILEAFKRIQVSHVNADGRMISGRMTDLAKSMVTRFGIELQFDMSRPLHAFVYETLTALDAKMRTLIEDKKFMDLKLVKEAASTTTQLLGRALTTENSHPRDNMRMLFGQLHEAIRGYQKMMSEKDARIDAMRMTECEKDTRIDGLKSELEFEREGWGKLGTAFFDDETKTMEECLIEAARIAAQGRKQNEFTINMDVFTESCRRHAGDGLNDFGWPTVKTAGTLLTSIKESCDSLRAYRSTLIKIQGLVKGSPKIKSLNYNCVVGDLDQLVEAVSDCISIEASNTRVVVRDVLQMIEKIENHGLDARRRLKTILPIT